MNSLPIVTPEELQELLRRPGPVLVFREGAEIARLDGLIREGDVLALLEN